MIDTSELGLPANIDAERLILGAVVTRPDLYPLASAVLEAGDFILEKHQRIYERAGAVIARGDHLDLVTLANALKDAGELEACDGLSYLASLNDGLPEIFSIDAYVRIVREKSVSRRAIEACDRTIKRLMASARGNSPVEDIQAAERVLRDLSVSGADQNSLKSVSEIIESLDGGLDAFLNPQRSAGPVVPLPWASVNDGLTRGGLRPGQLVTLAARTSGGKSAAALQIAENTAQMGKTAAVFTLEMSAEETLERMAASRARVDSRRWQAGYADRAEQKRIYEATLDLSAMPLFIDDSTTATLAAITAALRKLQAKQAIDLVIVDYLQIMRATGRFEKRADEVSGTARGLKLLAREFRVPVLMLSQFNRDGKAGDRPPQLSDLKESSEIEQASDKVIFLHSKYDPANSDDVINVDFIIAKQRNGPTASLPLQFHRPFVRFGESHLDFEVRQ